MKFDLSNLINADISDEAFDIKDKIDLADPDVKLIAPLSVQVRFTKAGDIITAYFNVTGEVELNCNRCLAELKRKVEISSQQDYVPYNMKQEDEILEESRMAGFVIDENNRVDVSQVLREELVIEALKDPVCKKECRGLCPGCGKNLNQGSCNCEKERLTKESPFGKLKKFKSNRQ